MSDGVRKMPEFAEAAWWLGGWSALCALVRADALDADWYECPACGGSGEYLKHNGDVEFAHFCDGCQGDGYQMPYTDYVRRPLIPAWAKP